MAAALDDPDKVLSPNRVCDLAGVSRTTLWRLQRSGDFPASIRLSPNRIGFRAGDLDAWFRSRGGAQADAA